MIARIRNRLQNYRLTKYTLLKMIPICIFLMFLLLGISSGIADPTSPPPGQ